MRKTEFLPSTAMTAEDVLEIIRDRYRHAAQLDPEVERGIDLTLESTIAEWRASSDLLPAPELWPALNAWFEVAFTVFEWSEVLEPANVRTLGGACELIARQAIRSTIQPFRVLGIECMSAGTFLTVRSLLVKAGVPVQNVRPSSQLAPYARQYFTMFITEIGRLAPGALPVPMIENTAAYKASMTALALGFVALIAAFKWHELFVGAAILLGIGFIGVWICSKYPPRAVRFGTLVTFRDLAQAVLRHQTP